MKTKKKLETLKQPKALPEVDQIEFNALPKYVLHSAMHTRHVPRTPSVKHNPAIERRIMDRRLGHP